MLVAFAHTPALHWFSFLQITFLIKQPMGPVGPKDVRAEEEHFTIGNADGGGKIVDSIVTTSKVPYADSFQSVVRYHITATGEPESSMLRATLRVEFRKKVIKLMKKKIRKETVKQIKAKFRTLDQVLSETLAEYRTLAENHTDKCIAGDKELSDDGTARDRELSDDDTARDRELSDVGASGDRELSEGLVCGERLVGGRLSDGDEYFTDDIVKGWLKKRSQRLGKWNSR